MARYGNVTILPADPNPWASALGLLGGIMGKNAADRQGVKDTDAFISSITPTDANPSLLGGNQTMQAPNATATTGGLLNGNLKDNISAGMTPQVAQPQPQTMPQPTQQPFRQTPQMATMPQQAQPKTWNDVQNQYNVNWGTKLRATLANMSPEARKQYLPQIMQMREQDLATLKTEWTKQETANNWDLFNNETNPTNKIALANKLGLPTESVKFALQPNVTTQLVNMGGQYKQVGTNRFTGEMINMETGQPLTQADLQVTMTPYQAGSLSNQAAGIAARGSGGSNSADNKMITNAKYAVDKHAKWVQDHTNKYTNEPPDETQSPYYGYAQQGQKILDSYYGIGTTAEEAAPSTDVTSKIEQARAAGYTDEQIAAYMGVPVEQISGGISEEASSGIDFSAPTFGSNNETVLDYLNNGTWLEDLRERNRNIGK